jgi:hypothetical protein
MGEEKTNGQGFVGRLQSPAQISQSRPGINDDQFSGC